jgi:hypothetical protein
MGGPTGGCHLDSEVHGADADRVECGPCGAKLGIGGPWGPEFGGVASYTSTSFRVRFGLKGIILLVAS